MFPFGARGVRFVVGLPVFLYASGRSFAGVGGFLAVWKADCGGAPVAIALAEPDSLGAEPALFGPPFAVNSALRSCPTLAYAGSKKAAEDVGFYYAADAAGRLMGALLSGLLFQAGGLIACPVGSSAMLAAYAAITFALPTAERARAIG